MKKELRTIAATRKAAKELAGRLEGSELLLLVGELATGKTTFVKFLAEALGFEPDEVSSPSFTIINRYSSAKRSFGICHIDLYRLEPGTSLEPLGLEQVLGSEDLVIVEWPETGMNLFGRSARPKLLLRFKLSGGTRSLTVETFRGGPGNLT